MKLINAKMNNMSKSEKKSDRMVGRYEDKEGNLRLKIGKGSLNKDMKLRERITKKRNKVTDRLIKLEDKGKRLSDYAKSFVEKEKAERANIPLKTDQNEIQKRMQESKRAAAFEQMKQKVKP